MFNGIKFSVLYAQGYCTANGNEKILKTLNSMIFVPEERM